MHFSLKSHKLWFYDCDDSSGNFKENAQPWMMANIMNFISMFIAIFIYHILAKILLCQTAKVRSNIEKIF